jgi:hypothetical protein
MATVTTRIPSSSNYVRTAALAAIAVLTAAGLAAIIWSLADLGSETDGNVVTPSVKSADQVQAEFETGLLEQRAATTFSTTVKSPDQVRAEFEAALREQSAIGNTMPSVKSADQVRAEFEAGLREQRAASRAPISVKPADQVRTEFETWLRDQLRPPS